MNTVTLHFKADNQQLTALDGLYKLASNTVEYVKAIFTLGENWAGFDVVRAAWYTDFECISTVLDGNGECFVPWEVLSRPEGVTINLYGCDLEEESDGEAVLVDRLTTYPVKAILVDVDARVCGSETKPVTPSQFEQYIAIVQELVGTVRDITSCVLNPDYTLTINYSDDTSDTVGPIRGEQGEQGPTGPAGNGISKIEKISTAGLVDTYRITFTNGTHKDYTVTNGAKGDTGNGIESIYLTGTSGAVKTYTILFTNGNTFEYQVTDGEVTRAELEQALPTDSASGAIASFPDGTNLFPAKSLTVDINPVQDLHGYDSPWVGGGGVNRLEPVSGMSNGITFTPNADGTINLNGTFINNAWTQIIATHTLSEMGLSVGDTTTIYSDLHIGIESYDENDARINFSTAVNQFKTYTIPSGTVYVNILFYAATTASGIAGTSINGNYKYLVAKGSINTWTPYSNICPISGRSSVGVTDCGKNLFDKSTVVFGERFNAGGTTSVTNTLARSALIRIKPSTAYYFTNVVSAQTYSCVWWYDKDGNNVGYNSIAGGIGEAVSGTFTSPATAYYVGVNLYGTHIDDAMVHEGSSASAYEQYNGTTTTIPLGQTVYGGTDEVVSGVLTDKMGEVDLGNLTWLYDTSLTHPFMRSTGISALIKRPATSGTMANILCSAFETQASYDISTNGKQGIAVHTDGSLRCATPNMGTDPTAFKSFVSGMQLVYEKATPTEIQLTPTQVACLLGQNNIFADCGDVAVTYKADVQRWVEKKLGA